MKKTSNKPITLTVDKEKNTELIQKTEVPDSPFVIVTTEEGSFAALGKYRLTEVYKTKQEAIDHVSRVTWNRIIQVISLVTEILKEAKK